jgi:hypothetical protein
MKLATFFNFVATTKKSHRFGKMQLLISLAYSIFFV